MKLQHGYDTMLNKRASGRSIEICIVFFFDRMRGMICRDNINAIIDNGFQNFLLIVCCFDGWIPFDVHSQSSIVSIIKPKMMNTGFGSNFLFRERYRVIKVKSLFCG